MFETAHLSPQELRAQEDALFKRWQAQTQWESFTCDGAPKPEVFLNSKSRIVFALKEVNAPGTEGVFDLRSQLEEQPHSWWGRTMAYWCAALHLRQRQPSWQDLEEYVRRTPLSDVLAPFAFLQLKKSAGGGKANDGDILRFAQDNAAFIRAQMALYQPHLVIACGKVVSDALNQLFAPRQAQVTHRGLRYTCGQDTGCSPAIVSYMHPSVRASKVVVSFGLMDAASDVLDREGALSGTSV